MNRCPFDCEILASNDVNGYRYFSCERCGGYWIPGGAIDRALSARGVLELRAVPTIERSKLCCPDCHALLEMIFVHGCVLDSCARCHGIWLDAGEAQRVSKLFPDGSPILDADRNRVGQTANGPVAALSVVEGVVNLLLFVAK